jgi:hypothetical protein
MPKRSHAIALSALLLASCGIARMETNEPIDAQIVRTFRPGYTTARQVTEQLGAPTQVVQLGRRSAYLYDASASKSAALILGVFNMYAVDTRTDRVWLFFDESDHLTHCGASFGVHRAQYALPWEGVHDPEDHASRDANRAGLQGKE